MPEAPTGAALAAAAESGDEGAREAETTATRGPRPGEVIGGCFKLVSLLGKGNMGTVFEAEHVRLGKAFAVKMMRADDSQQPRARARFKEEARALARVSSVHVVSVVDTGEDRGVPYLVMEKLEGCDLRRELEQRGKLPIARTLRILVEAAEGIAAVHRAGLVHRDMKPANLFLSTEPGGRQIAKVLDFGVVRSEAGNGTKTGGLVGTIRYMAPEQLGDSRSVGPRTDVYALGCILYEALGGEPPHRGETVEELMFDILHRDPPGLRGLRSEVSVELEELVAWTLHRAPAERCPSALALAQALRTLPDFEQEQEADAGTTLDHTGDTPPRPRPPRPQPAARPWPWLIGASILSLGAGVVLGLGLDDARDAQAEMPGTGAVAPVDVKTPALARVGDPPIATSAEGRLPLAPVPSPGAPSASSGSPSTPPSAAPARRSVGSSPGKTTRLERSPPRAAASTAPAWGQPLEMQNPYVD